MFSCEFCEISKDTFFTEHLWTTASIRTKWILVESSLFTLVYLPSFAFSLSTIDDFKKSTLFKSSVSFFTFSYSSCNSTFSFFICSACFLASSKHFNAILGYTKMSNYIFWIVADYYFLPKRRNSGGLQFYINLFFTFKTLTEKLTMLLNDPTFH